MYCLCMFGSIDEQNVDIIVIFLFICIHFFVIVVIHLDGLTKQDNYLLLLFLHFLSTFLSNCMVNAFIK